jgi:hypothetical protein
MGVKCEKYFLVERDPRTFTVVGSSSNIIVHEIGGRIISVSLPDMSITRGDIITVDKKPFKVNDINRSILNNDISYAFSTVRLTKSSLFLLPMLGGTRRLFMYNKLFVNAFIAAEQHEDCIALLYRFSGDTIFLKFEQALKKFNSFRDTFDPSPYFVMFIFNVPDSYRNEYDLYMGGKYSKFSPEFKSRIMEFHGFNIHGEMAQILFQDEKRRLRLQEELDAEIEPGSELLSIIDVEEETFNPKIYI